MRWLIRTSRLAFFFFQISQLLFREHRLTLPLRSMQCQQDESHTSATAMYFVNAQT
jgi:hypothetical protein